MPEEPHAFTTIQYPMMTSQNKTQRDPQPWQLHIPQPRRTSWFFLAVFFTLALAMSAAIVFLVFRDPRRWLWPAWRLQTATHGALDLTLSANVLNLIVLVGGVLILIGGMRAKDLGLAWSRLPLGVLATMAVLIGLYIFQWIAFKVTGQTMGWNPAWNSADWPAAMGRWLNQLFGNTLFEEIVYRGFLLGQIYLLLGRKYESRPQPRLTLALLISQALFALSHVPINLANNASPWIFVAQFVSGLLFAGVYLLTRNLFFVMGVHTLVNGPPPPWSEWVNGGVVTGVAMLIAVIAALIWTLIARRRSDSDPIVRLSSESVSS
jgi:membrane protease YdiL (CAAX protease family)